MKTIVVLSGKGGVGKSSITGSLAVEIAKTRKILALDCDVDTPNLHLVLGELKPYKTEPLFTSLKAEISQDKCTHCGLCYENCKFDAIEKKDYYSINQFRCEGCNTCSLVCPVNAISIHKVHNADILYFKTKYGFELITGRLKVGESGSGKIVYELRKRAENEIVIIDAPAGIGCPITSSITGSDYVVAVTEPTPSAFSDLKRALTIVQHFKIPYGIIINRYDLNKGFSSKIESYAKENNIEILEKIPYDKAFVTAIVDMKPVLFNKKFSLTFKNLAMRCLKNVF